MKLNLGLSNDEFSFGPNADGPARYNIIHFKQVSPGDFQWVQVGEYQNGQLLINLSEVQFRLDKKEMPESVCSHPCKKGQAKKLMVSQVSFEAYVTYLAKYVALAPKRQISQSNGQCELNNKFALLRNSKAFSINSLLFCWRFLE